MLLFQLNFTKFTCSTSQAWSAKGEPSLVVSAKRVFIGLSKVVAPELGRDGPCWGNRALLQHPQQAVTVQARLSGSDSKQMGGAGKEQSRLGGAQHSTKSALSGTK